MADQTRTVFPGAAIDQIAGSHAARVLTLGGTRLLPQALLEAQHEVFVVDRDERSTRSAPGGAIPVTARAEGLPFDPCQFDVVCTHQMLHRFERPRTFSEVARVLRPGGHFAVSYLQRDDSLPWVRRLAALVHTVDPDSMRGKTGADSVDSLTASKYFPAFDQRSFRVWMPTSVRALVAQVGRAPRVAALSDADRTRFLAQVHDLLADSTGGMDSLRLPYELTVWRAFVDHDELTAPISARSDALVIKF